MIKIFIEYCRLKRLHKFYLTYREFGDEGIGDFLKLCKLAKKEGVSRQQVVKLLQLADEDDASGILQLERRRKWLIDKIHYLDMQIERSKNYLYNLSNEIANARKLLSDYNMSCEHKRQELKNINSEASRIVTLVNRFKNDNEEYLKIKKTVEERVISILTDNKHILQFALASVIEAIRNPEKYYDLFVDNASLSSTTIAAQQSPPPLHIEGYKDMILDEAKMLYDKLLNNFIDSIMDNTAASSSPHNGSWAT